MRKRTILALAVLVTVAMVFEWKFVSLMAEGRAIHNYHGICNGGVGEPYSDFIHQLRTICESGDTNRLAAVLRRADQHSRDIYGVWLGGDRDAYRKSIDEIFQ